MCLDAQGGTKAKRQPFVVGVLNQLSEGLEGTLKIGVQNWGEVVASCMMTWPGSVSSAMRGRAVVRLSWVPLGTAHLPRKSRCDMTSATGVPTSTFCPKRPRRRRQRKHQSAQACWQAPCRSKTRNRKSRHRTGRHHRPSAGRSGGDSEKSLGTME